VVVADGAAKGEEVPAAPPGVSRKGGRVGKSKGAAKAEEEEAKARGIEAAVATPAQAEERAVGKVAGKRKVRVSLAAVSCFWA
jgi:hypothetical protein